VTVTAQTSQVRGLFHLTDQDRQVIVGMARELTGTNLDGERHGVIFLNVQLRMEHVGAATLGAYLNYINDHDEEIPYLLSALTIHTTGWFREPSTFELFREKIEDLIKGAPSVDINLLSIGCSTGEEVYSYAFVLEELRRRYPGLRYSLRGIDIDPISLKKARAGRYDGVKLANIDPAWRELVARRLDAKGVLQIDHGILERVSFQSANVLAIPPRDQMFDVISVRNILIYFDPPQLSKIMAIIQKHLKSSGLLFTGVSETQLPDRSKFLPVGGALFTSRAREAKIELTRVSPKKIRKEVHAMTHLVIIEDEEDLADLYKMTLQDSFKRVDVALTFEQGLDSLAASTEETFVIADYMLACGRSGLDLMDEARKRGFSGSFVLISAFADETIANRAHSLGCKDVIAKPCVGAELLRIVRHHAGLSGQKSDRGMVPAEMVALGSSTGGTEVLIKILENLSQPSPPVAVVQHIVPDFAADFAKRLAARSGLVLAKMEDGEVVKPGHLYMALGDYHIGLRKSGGVMRLVINRGEPVSGHRPSVDFLFESLAQTKIPSVAIILTGMGRDGAIGLSKIREGGSFTMAQDEASSTVFGMPGEAIKLGAAEFIGNPMKIRQKLHEILALAIK
jgi:two-component system chemotaxis response regulator CheB